MSKKSKKALEKQNLGKYIFIIFSLFLFVGAGKTVVQVASFNFDKPYSQVLGDSEDAQKQEDQHQSEVQNQEQEKPEPQKQEENKQSSGNTNQSESIKQAQEQQKEQQKKQIEAVKKQQEIIREKQKEMEIETKDGAKIKVKREDNNQIKVELEKGNLHFKYESTPSGVVKKVENETGDMVGVSKKQLDLVEKKIETELEDNGISVSTKEGETSISRGGFTATTVYPLSVGGQNTLAITTPAGEQQIKLTPDQIVNELKGILDVASPSANLSNNSIEIKVKDGQPVYEVNGKKSFKFLRIFDIPQSQKLIVSADTGDIIATEQSLLTNLISILSF